MAASSSRRSHWIWDELRAVLPVLLLALLITTLAWWPSISGLADLRADQVWENFGIGNSCIRQPVQLGWLGGHPLSGGASLFGASIPGPLLTQAACRLSQLIGLAPLQAYLLLGQLCTVLLATISCRWAGFGRGTAVLAGVLIATAPCAFSRIGHVGLAVLLPVLPALVACLQLQRGMLSTLSAPRLLGSGAIACLLAVPVQDYYTVFTLLLLLATLALLLLLSADLRRLLAMAGRGALFMAGFLAVLVLLFLPKILTAFGPATAIAPAMETVPATWSAVRVASEQFQYGLLPLTWFIPSPWIPPTAALLNEAGIPTTSESFFWSAGSLLIPIAWLVAIRRLATSFTVSRSVEPDLSDQDRRFLALLLLLTTAIGLMVMTMGGLGTIFAALVSPVLRSLNRFTVFVYGASLLYLLAEFDCWQQRRIRRSSSMQP